MRNGTTINEIAAALGLSRNTVSRALSGKGIVAEETKNRIVQTAESMGYGIVPAFTQTSALPHKTQTIVFVTRLDANSSGFFASIVSGIESCLREHDCVLSFVIMRPSDFKSSTFPQSLKYSNGIICADIFDSGYIAALFSTGVPLVTIDSNWDKFKHKVPHSTIMMENFDNVKKLMSELISRGHKNIAFVGNPNYCRGFYERYQGYSAACFEAGIIPHRDMAFFDFTAGTALEGKAYMDRRTKRPTAFVCANDYHASVILETLRLLGVSVPDEAEVVGFDDLTQFEHYSITTVHTFTEQLGRRAAEEVLARIANPSMPAETVYMPTERVYKNSTR